MAKNVFGLVVALLLVAGGQVMATEYYKKVVYTETVYVKQTKTVPYQVEIVKYDHCGKPYCVTETRYKDITVTVPKVVEKVKYVKLCD